MRAATIGELEELGGPVELAEYDPEWPQLYEREAARIREALGERALVLEHVGSTAVPGLVAKPRIDILLVVADSTEIDRLLGFRDHLRANEADRELYARTKRDLARRDWKYMQNYADAKTEVIEEIVARAQRHDRRASR